MSPDLLVSFVFLPISSSHLHWDHIGDPTPFVNAEIVLGSDAKVLLEDTWPSNHQSVITALPPNMKAEFVDFAEPKKYQRVAPWGPYDRAVDLYDDGSFYLVDSPGHIPGHLAAAARIAGAVVPVAGRPNPRTKAARCVRLTLGGPRTVELAARR